MFESRKSLFRLAVIAAAALTVSCSNHETVMGQDRELLLGVIQIFRDSVEITAPDSVVAGTPFEITVNTYGNGCVGLGETRVTVTGLTAEIEPFDWVVTPHPGAFCTDELNRFSHVATVEFVEKGTATLRVRGRRGGPGGKVLEVERSIAVRY